jgi:hypothetical protein
MPKREIYVTRKRPGEITIDDITVWLLVIFAAFLIGLIGGSWYGAALRWMANN